MSSVVRVGVGVVVLGSRAESSGNPRILVGRRRGSHGAGTWALPGGHLEFGESLEACASRELLEETGLVVPEAEMRFWTATNDYMPWEGAGDGPGKHYVTMFMVCARDDDTREPELLEPEKCDGWAWWTWDELMSHVRPVVEGKAGDAAGDGRESVKIFAPLVNLVRQRPGMVPKLL